MHAFRWWLYKMIGYIAWWICPEPQRSAIGVTYNLAVKQLKKLETAN